MKVKALSFRQPWAELVLQGRKTLDLRTWKTGYRGQLAVFASQTAEKEACRLHGLDPDQLSSGAVIGLVELVRVVALDRAAYDERASEHLGGRGFQEPLFGWELANPRPLAAPVPVHGRLRLFSVNLPEFEETTTETPERPATGIAGDPREALWGSSLPFELRLSLEKQPNNSQASYRLGLYQRKVKPLAVQYRQPPEQMECVVELGGVALRAVADQVLEALRQNGYNASDLNSNRREPFALQEEWGVRLGLLFLTARRISKLSRIEVISSGIRQMSSEELYYWYSKCTSQAIAERAQKALRILLAEE